MGERLQNDCKLNLKIPIRKRGEAQYNSWLADRTVFEGQEHLLTTLGQVGGLELVARGGTSEGFGRDLEPDYCFWYEDLAIAVNRFAEKWRELNFPDRTRLTHGEWLPADPFYRCHVMIRWIDGRMDPFSTTLSDNNLLTPQNA